MASQIRSLRWPSLSATPNDPPVCDERSRASLVSAARQTTETRSLEETSEASVLEMDPGSHEVREERSRRTSREECEGR